MSDRQAQPLPGPLLRAVAAIVDAAADRVGNDHWRAMARRVRTAADDLAPSVEEAAGE